MIGNQLGNHYGRASHHGMLLRLGPSLRMIGANQLIGNQPILGQVANLTNRDQQMMMMIGQAVAKQESMMMMTGVRGLLAKRVRMMMIGRALQVVIGIRRDGVGIE